MSSVTICIPVFNGALYLPECLESALSQSYRDFDIVVVDDCSTDDSCAIVERFAHRDARIRLHRNVRNLGLVGNWNRCLELATGEWIKFLFQDDWLSPDCLSSLVARARRPLAFCARRLLFDSSMKHDPLELGTIHMLSDLVGHDADLSREEVCALVLQRKGNFFGEPTAALLHRSLFEKFGRFNPDLHQMCDLEYWIRVGTNTGITYVASTLAAFRFHASSTSALHYNLGEQERPDRYDALILAHELGYNPHFASLRRMALTRFRRDLRQEFARKAFYATLAARKSSHASPSHASHRSTAGALRAIQDRYPGMSNKWRQLPYQCKEGWKRGLQIWDRHIGWRFQR